MVKQRFMFSEQKSFSLAAPFFTHAERMYSCLTVALDQANWLGDYTLNLVNSVKIDEVECLLCCVVF